MEFNPSLPIYLQVMTAIKRDIVTGRLALGEKLPSVRDLALQYTINPNTAGRVYQELMNEGVCFTRRGMGTFVTEDEQKAVQMKREMAHGLVQDYLRGMQKIGIAREEAARYLMEAQEEERTCPAPPSKNDCGDV